jgi:hypothetical protein
VNGFLWLGETGNIHTILLLLLWRHLAVNCNVRFCKNERQTVSLCSTSNRSTNTFWKDYQKKLSTILNYRWQLTRLRRWLSTRFNWHHDFMNLTVCVRSRNDCTNMQSEYCTHFREIRFHTCDVTAPRPLFSRLLYGQLYNLGHSAFGITIYSDSELISTGRLISSTGA